MIETLLTALAASGWLAAIAAGIAWFDAHDAAELAESRLAAFHSLTPKGDHHE